MKIDELASTVGLGWALNAGGVINVIQNGQSDLDLGGWANPSPNFVTPQNETLPENWDGRAGWDNNNEYLFLKYSADNTLDTQPDIFAFSFLGKSGKFFFDQSGGIHLMPHQNLKITYTKANDRLTSVTITDERGTKFLFNVAESVSTTTISCIPAAGSTQSSSSASLYLSKIISTNNEEVVFNYENSAYTIVNPDSEIRYLRTDIGAPQYMACEVLPNCVNTSTSIYGGLRLKEIVNSATNDKISFQYAANNITRLDVPGNSILDAIEVISGNSVIVKRFELNHGYFYSTTANSTNVNDFRLKLNSVHELGKAPYLLDYNNIAIPSRLSFNQDHWGYYNGPVGNTTLLPVDELRGFTTGANRAPDTTYAKPAF